MAILLQTFGEQLAEVQVAIQKVLTGQRYELNGRSMWRADLEYLHKREQDLTSAIEVHGYDAKAGQTTQRGAYRVSFIDG